MSKLGWGYNAALPTAVKAAWGARMISQPQLLDLVYNRTDWIGEPDETKNLMEWLNSGPLHEARKTGGALVYTELAGDKSGEVVLYEDERGRIVGSANRSFGYVYVAAWLYEDVDMAGEAA